MWVHLQECWTGAMFGTPAGMTGKDLSDAIARDGNGVKTIFMSGYTDEIITTRGVLPSGVNFIQKPFTTDSLVEGLRQALGQVG